MDHDDAIAGIEGVMDGEVTGEWSPPRPLQVLDRARLRSRITRQVRECRRCDLGPGSLCGGVCREPVAPALQAIGRLTTGLITGVLGEAPDKEDDELGRGFMGKPGKLLRTLLGDVGFDGMWTMHMVNCRPAAPHPTEQETEACGINLEGSMDGMHAGGIHHVLLVGAGPTKAWRPDLKVTNDHGVVGIWRRYNVMVMPVLHPASILRSKEFLVSIREDLEKWREVVEDGTLAALEQQCVRCGGDPSMWDADGLPWCYRHGASGSEPGSEPEPPVRSRRRGRRVSEGQLGMGLDIAGDTRTGSGSGEWVDPG